MSRANPYFITGPALISFSGGRTSGYMLKHILDAHGGTLPPDVYVGFANTGKEWSTTLDFVAECERQWGVPITWIERTWETAEGFIEVGHNSADRRGRPLRETIERRRFLPNGVSRFCTTEAKVHVLRRWMQAQGYKRWTNVIGLRKDEPKRVKKQQRRNLLSKEVYTTVMPLDAAGVGQDDVLAWWRLQPFDLRLPNDSSAFGNCDLCHLKHRARLLQVLLHDPSAADWWIDCETWATDVAQKPTGARFRKDGPTYAELKAYVLRYPQAARAEVEAFLESERIAKATGDLFVDGESIDCACTD